MENVASVSDLVVEELLALQQSKSPSYSSLLGAQKHLAPIFSTPAKELTIRQIEGLLLSISSDSARAKCRMLLRRAYQRGIGDGIVDRNPVEVMPRLPLRGGRDPRIGDAETLSLDEVKRLLKFDRPLRGLWALCIGTGMRASEALAITDADIDIHEGVYRVLVNKQLHRDWKEVRETKTSSIREVAVGKWVIELIPSLPFNISEKRAWAHWQHDLEVTGLRPRRLHATRHTFISLLASLGTPEEVIREMTHPRTHDAFSGYLHRGFGPKAKAARALEAAIRS